MTSREQALALFRKGADEQVAVEEMLRSGRFPAWIVAFHCQQAAEKML